MKRILLLIIICQLNCSAQTFLNFQADSLWGLMNEEGDTLLEPQFTFVYGWNNVALYYKGSMGSIGYEAGLITEDLRVIPLSNRVQLNVAFGSVKRFTENYFFFWGKKGKGVVNSNGEIVVSPIFDRIDSFDNDDEALCRKGRRWGVIDISGNFVIEPKYLNKEKATLMHMHAKVGLNKKKYSYIKWDQRRNGLVPAYKGIKPSGEYGELSNRWGFLSEDGREVSEFIFPEGTRFTNGVGYVKSNSRNYTIRHRDFLPHNIAEEKVVFERGPVTVTQDTNQLTGEVINVIYNRWKDKIFGLGEIEFVYPSDSTLSFDAFTVFYKHKEYYENKYHLGVYNLLAYQMIIEPKYDRIELTPDDKFLVEKDKKFGLIYRGNRWVISLDYDSIRHVSNNLFELHKNGIISTVNTLSGTEFKNSLLEESGDTSIHYMDHNIKDYLILRHNEYFIYKPKFDKRNEIVKYVQKMNRHIIRIELQFGNWGYINIDSGKLIYWNGLDENKKIIEGWASHLPLLYSL